MFKRGVAICSYNRGSQLESLIDSVLSTVPNKTTVVICDDNSTDDTLNIVTTKFSNKVGYYRGPNLGAAQNKNRALFALQDKHIIAILEDDLFPTEPGWLEQYEQFMTTMNVHHICRVQDRFVDETSPAFTEYSQKTLGLTPIYGPSPRGDLTVLTSLTLRKVGGFHADFIGVGAGHGHWSDRVAAAGLCGHPNKWIDVKEASVKFKQAGDREGGRWAKDPAIMQAEIAANKQLRARLGTKQIFQPLILP